MKSPKTPEDSIWQFLWELGIAILATVSFLFLIALVSAGLASLVQN